MKTILAIALAVVACSCNRDSDTVIGPHPQPPAGYPFTLKFSPERYAVFASEWQKFSAEYNIPATIPAFDSALMTPLAIPPVDLLPATSETLSIAQAHDAILGFMHQWSLLFNTDGYFHVQYENDLPWDRSYAFRFSRYSQEIYFFSSLNSAGGRVSHDGILSNFESYCVPVIPINAHAAYSLEDAIHIAVGQKLIYYGWQGQDTVVVTPGMIEEAVLMPKMVPTYSVPSYRYASIEYRYCWRLKVRVYYVYVDAVTGEFLDYKEQYVIF